MSGTGESEKSRSGRAWTLISSAKIMYGQNTGHRRKNTGCMWIHGEFHLDSSLSIRCILMDKRSSRGQAVIVR